MLKKKKSDAIQNIIIGVTALAFIAVLVVGSMINDAASTKKASQSE